MATEGRDGAASLAEGVAKWVAVASAIIAAGQAGSAWIAGSWHSEAEAARAREERELALVRERSVLAEKFLTLLLSKDTQISDRPTLYAALATINEHPLQGWARERARYYAANEQRLRAAEEAQLRAAEERRGAEAEASDLRAQIALLNARREAARENPTLAEQIQAELVRLSRDLGRASAATVVAQLRVEETQTIVRRTGQGEPAVQPAPHPTNSAPQAIPQAIPQSTPPAAPRPAAESRTESLVTLSAKVTVELVMSVFPAAARRNVEANLGSLRDALQEFGVADPRVTAAILATIAVETPHFEAYEEPERAGLAYEGRLGNSQAGDGVRYRGRGYLGLTGRANYTQMSQRLGLGTRLVDFPEDAKSPEVASRILVAYLVDRQARFLPALAQGDLAAARRVVAGAATNLERFTEVYNRLLGQL